MHVYASLIVVWTLRAVGGFSSGKVDQSCDTMEPQHHTTSQTSQAPFSISMNHTTFQKGDVIAVTLQAGPNPFKGFLLQARGVGQTQPLGTFTVTGSDAQLLNCRGFANSAVSHTSASPKTSVKALWTAPVTGNPGNITFSATFVQAGNVYWTQVKSSVVIYNAEPLQNTNATTPSLLTISSNGCGISKVCMSQPGNCNPANSSSCYFMSVVMSSNSSDLHMEISGPSDGYIAIGFYYDLLMGNDDIYICIYNQGQVQVQRAHSTGMTTPDIISQNISGISVSYANGVISCSFTSHDLISFYRSSTPTTSSYLFYAYGPVSGGLIQQHIDKFTSKDRVQLTPSVTKAVNDSRPAKAHGSLMLIAWMTTGSLGMIIARYLKTATEGRSYWNRDFWFLAHVGLLSLSYTLTIIAFILIFANAGDWFDNPHSVLGCLVMILTFFQPIVAIFRCQPSHKWRYLFNWIHALNGLTIKCLAVAAIFTGLKLVDTSANHWLPKVMGGFVGWEALFFLLFDLHAQWSKNIGPEVFEDISSLVPLEVIFLIVFFFGNIIFLIALLCGIGLS
ncbi:putative ferric-chelate reductase 1 [Brienomyrus brachyistius]|uniref:putative ferric-chelate reductase 1 n=1 Tax=Brienomyrus brachyistius TaxID=42636 RepID=UPI0020B240ED|nr:putative ferric-chelate reductase 1 [Brienomyrus brachyistius]XP_048832554.1 putative ferric-chelate reductase 1 [Brienomyrus brachyistius]